MSRAADYGIPKIRVRKVLETGRWIFRRQVYEVEFTEIGESTPAWVRGTTDPACFLRPCHGLADGHAVKDGADSDEGLLLLATAWSIIAIGPGTVLWTPGTLSIDSLRLDRVADHRPHGTADPEDEARHSTVDLRTGAVTGGSV